MTALAAVIAALATYRLTLLVVADELTAPPRDALRDWLNQRKHGPQPTGGAIVGEAMWQRKVAEDPHRLAYLVECPWCASPYVAVPVVWATLQWAGTTGWWLTIGVAAASGVTGFLASKASP